MTDNDYPEDIDFDFEEIPCETCHGQGYLVICIDDLCANSDHCIHGDGEIICPDCRGYGVRIFHEPDEYYNDEPDWEELSRTDLT